MPKKLYRYQKLKTEKDRYITKNYFQRIPKSEHGPQRVGEISGSSSDPMGSKGLEENLWAKDASEALNVM